MIKFLSVCDRLLDKSSSATAEMIDRDHFQKVEHSMHLRDGLWRMESAVWRRIKKLWADRLAVFLSSAILRIPYATGLPFGGRICAV